VKRIENEAKTPCLDASSLLPTLPYTLIPSQTKFFWGAYEEMIRRRPRESTEPQYHVEEQPLPSVDSPTAESPGYVTESDPEEYEDDKTEDGPVDYLMDGGDDGDDDDGDSLWMTPMMRRMTRRRRSTQLSDRLRERLARCTAPPALSSPPPVPFPLLSSSGCPT
ncbi:hypothetical protein Tco_0924457, partial [Tanacetum coccineum]